MSMLKIGHFSMGWSVGLSNILQKPMEKNPKKGGSVDLPFPRMIFSFQPVFFQYLFQDCPVD